MAASVASILILCLAAAGCGSGTAAKHVSLPLRTSSAVAPPPAVPSPLSLPIKTYELPEQAAAQEQYVEQRMIQQCMARFGFHYLPGLSAQVVHTVELIDREYDSRRYGVTDAEAVRTYGYQLPAWTAGPDATAGKPPAAELAVLVGSANRDGGRIPPGGCMGQADRALAADGIHGGGQSAALVSQLKETGFEHAQADPRVHAVVTRWSACMRSHGLDYTTPFAAGADPRWRASGHPDPTQITVAETDVTCKVSTHLVAVEVAVESAYDEAEIAANIQRLAPVRESVTAQAEAIARVMAATN